MKRAIPYLINAGSLVSGFLGWVILGNLIFFGLFKFVIVEVYIDYEYLVFGISLVIWLIAIITVRLLLLKRRTWILIGVLAAIILGAASWIVMLFEMRYVTLLEFITLPIFPFPAGFLIFYTRSPL